MISRFVDRLKDLLPGHSEAPTSVPPGEFVKGINLGGEAVTIEGYLWDAYEVALTQGLLIPEASTHTTDIKPQPAVDRELRKMLNTVVYRRQTLEISQTLANGVYDVYLWIMENYQADWHCLEVKIGGQTIATQVGQLPLGHWVRYGAYPVNVTDGVLQVAIDTNDPKIDAHLMGLSIFRTVN